MVPFLQKATEAELLPGVIGRSAALQTAVKRVALISETDATGLLTGETGTGKELFARAIHYLSKRRSGPFVPVNCGAIPDHLFENELFGHVRGAYTDARSNERGLLACAENGTLFLDEVDAMSPGAQVKILRVLQEREYRPVGSARAIAANVRFVAATNSNLEKRVEAGQFREDLYFRLNILSLKIPPLRERLEDLKDLALHYVREYALLHHKPVPQIDEAAIDALAGHVWPGNVRELQTVIQRAVLTAAGRRITSADLELPERSSTPAPFLTMRAAKDNAIRHLEFNYLSGVMSRCDGNVTQAAKLAGRERRSFQRLLRKYSIGPATTKNDRKSA